MMKVMTQTIEIYIGSRVEIRNPYTHLWKTVI